MKRRWGKVPDAVRPIGARALTSAFDTLRPYLSGNVLDLFAGQGRFGLKAADEGADHVTFVEKSAAVAKELAKTVARDPNHEKLTICIQDAFPFLAAAQTAGTQFELVFADPPYELWNEEFSMRLAASVSPVLASSAIFVVKHPKRMVISLPAQRLEAWKSSPFGEANLSYFRCIRGES